MKYLIFGMVFWYTTMANTTESGSTTHRKCIATDGTEHEIGETWKPSTKLHKALPCIECACLKNGVVKCKQAKCQEILSCSNPVRQSNTCCLTCPDSNDEEPNLHDKAKYTQRVTFTEKHEQSESARAQSPFTTMRDNHRAATGWRQRLSDFNAAGGASLPKHTKQSAGVRAFGLYSLNDNEEDMQTFSESTTETRRQFEIHRRLQEALAARPTRRVDAESPFSFRDTSHAFGLLQVDSVQPEIHASINALFAQCQVQVMPGLSSKTLTYAHGDWWKATLPILGDLKCVECTCMNGEVKCKVPKCVDDELLPCAKPVTENGKCCASCPIRQYMGYKPYYSSTVDNNKHFLSVATPAPLKTSEQSKCDKKVHPILYRFVHKATKRSKDQAIAVRLGDSVEVYNWTLNKDDNPHRRHVIRMRVSNFKRYMKMSSMSGSYQLWSATTEGRLRKFEEREERWSTSCKSNCERRLMRIVTKMLLKSPEKVKCAMKSLENIDAQH
uniref:chordin-like protein 1 n=1 Tax=Styela clava TaxID=7725 RepID=UPI001939A98F|nr:chordin-like protein 1 [Styela clava]